MEIKQDLPKRIQKIVSDIDVQITNHYEAIKNLEFSKQMFIKHKPYTVRAMRHNSPLTRDLIRNFLKGYTQSIQTVNIIDLLYSGKSEEERNKLIKHLSVMLNQMNKEGEVVIEKKEGVKGNFYKWNAEIDE